MASEHEEAFIRAFVLPSRQQRFLETVNSPTKREVFLEELCHLRSRFLDLRFGTRIEGNLRLTPNILEYLRKLGASETCYVIGGSDDGKTKSLSDALSTATARQGVIVSCIPGKLAYVVSEDESLLFRR